MSILNPNELELHQIATAWPDLPDHVKETIITLIEVAGVSSDASMCQTRMQAF